MVVFKAPKSYTGEDSFEVYAHGGLAVMSSISKAFRGAGFEEAVGGEFTKRAFLNNKISFENQNFNDEIYIGIRPEDIELNNKNEIKLEIKKDLLENLGFEKIIHSTILNQDFIIKTSENITNGLKQISFAKNKIYLFDKKKKRIRN